MCESSVSVRVPNWLRNKRSWLESEWFLASVTKDMCASLQYLWGLWIGEVAYLLVGDQDCLVASAWTVTATSSSTTSILQTTWIQVLMLHRSQSSIKVQT